MFEVVVNMTSKGYHEPAYEYRNFHTEVKEFNTLDEANDYIKSEYFNCKKRVKQYVDTLAGESRQSGWIYCYKDSEWCHERGTWYHFLRQDWVSIYSVNRQLVYP